MAGWIKIYQSIREHWIWERPIYIKWWLDLLMLAEWKDRKRLIKSKMVTIGRGQAIASIRFLRERWKYRKDEEQERSALIMPQDKTILRFLRLLEQDGMITRDTETLPNHTTLITICNYEAYQSNSPIPYDTKDSTKDSGAYSTAESTKDSTEDSEYEDIIDIVDVEEITDKGEIKISPTISKNGNGQRFVPPKVEDVQALIDEKGYHFDAETFVAFYESKNWMIGKNKMKKWQMAAVTWEKRYKQSTPNRTDGRFSNNRQSDANAARQQRGMEYAAHIASKIQGGIDPDGAEVH